MDMYSLMAKAHAFQCSFVNAWVADAMYAKVPLPTSMHLMLPSCPGKGSKGHLFPIDTQLSTGDNCKVSQFSHFADNTHGKIPHPMHMAWPACLLLLSARFKSY